MPRLKSNNNLAGGNTPATPNASAGQLSYQEAIASEWSKDQVGATSLEPAPAGYEPDYNFTREISEGNYANAVTAAKQAGRSAANTIPNIAMSSFAGLVDWGKDSLLWLNEQIFDTAGKEEMASLFKGARLDPEQKITGAEMSEKLAPVLNKVLGTDPDYQTYRRNEAAFDFAGDMVDTAAIAITGTNAVKVGSTAYKALAKAGVPSGYLDAIFYNPNVANKSIDAVSKSASLLSRYGANKSMVSDANALAKSAGFRAGIEGTKAGLAGEAAIAASGFKHEEYYGNKDWLDIVLWHGALPAGLGYAIPATQTAHGVRKLFAKNADDSGAQLNKLLNYELKQLGMSEEVADSVVVNHQGALVNYGLNVNPASSVATDNAYTLKALNMLKQDVLENAKKAKVSPDTIKDIEASYDKYINTVKSKRLNALDALTSKALHSEDRTFVKSALGNALDNTSFNALSTAVRATKAPVSNKGFTELTNKRSETIAKLKQTAANPRTKEANKIKYLERAESLQAESNWLIDADGNIFDANDFHMRWRDNPENTKSITNGMLPVYAGSKVEQKIQHVKFTDDFFDKGTKYQLAASADGNIRVSRNGSDYRNLAYNDTGAFDASWVLLKRNLDWLKTKVKNKNDKNPLSGMERLANADIKIKLKLEDALPQQVAYWREILDTFGYNEFSKVFKFDENQLKLAYNDAANFFKLQPEDLDLSSVLWSKQVKSGKELMLKRSQINALLAKHNKFNHYTEDSIFNEATGLRMDNHKQTNMFSNETGTAKFLEASEPNLEGLADTSGELTREAKQYAYVTNSEAGSLSDRINNNLYSELAEAKLNRMKSLAGDESNANTLVSEITKLATDTPQYQNGWLDSPVGLGIGVDTLGDWGDLLMFQHLRHGDNVVLNSTVDFKNLVNSAITKKINDKIKPLTDSIKNLIKDSKASIEFAKAKAQLKAGYRLQGSALQWSDDAGGYVLLLDSEKQHINRKVNDHLHKFGRGDGSNAIDDGLLPDPETGQPLVVSEAAAATLEAQQQLNLVVHQGNKQLADSLGRREPPFMNYHVPADDFSKGAAMIIVARDSEKGQWQPQLYALGSNRAQATKMAELELANAGKSKDVNWAIKTPEEMGLDLRLMHQDVEDSYFGYANYSDFVRQEQSGGLGKYAGVRVSQGGLYDIGPDSLKAYLEANNSILQRQAARTRASLFYEQIEQAKQMQGGIKPGATGYQELAEYVNNLVGHDTNLMPSDNFEKFVQNVYDGVDNLLNSFGEAANYARNYPRIKAALEKAKIANKAKPDLTSETGAFKSYDEFSLLTGYGNRGYSDLSSAMDESLNRLGIKITNPMRSKEITALFNRVSTNALLRTANLGYATMNIMSLGAVSPMVRKALSRRLGETERMFQSRVGAYGRVLDNGNNLALDISGGMIETLNHYAWHFDEAKAIISEATEKGWLSTNASLINEVFLNQSDVMFNKAAKTTFKALSAIGDKSEEWSRIVPFLEGYRIAERSGLAHSSRMSLAKKFMDDVIGNYESANRPAWMKGSLGGAIGLFYTYIANVSQQYLLHFLNKDQAALASALTAQLFMFGTDSLPFAEEVENFFLPIGEGKDYYSALRENGYSDETARSIMHGFPSGATGLDFASKGDLAVNVPGFRGLPFFSLASNVADGLYEAAQHLANSTGGDGRVYWEILQTRMPVPIARSATNLALGYKTDRNHNKVIDEDRLGTGLWWASNLLSMNSSQERLNRQIDYRAKQYLNMQQAARQLANNGLTATLRSGNYENIGGAVSNWASAMVASGQDHKRLSQGLKTAFIKANVIKPEQLAGQVGRDQFKTSTDKNLEEAYRLHGLAMPTYDINNANPNLDSFADDNGIAVLDNIPNRHRH